MFKIVKNIATVSLSTILSRCLGLLRDTLMIAALGAGMGSSAFIVALTLPNLFRRLLGEGALSAAVVPLLSDRIQQSGRAEAYVFLNQVLSRLLAALVLLVVVGSCSFYGLSKVYFLDARWQLCAELAIWTFPYVGFICLSALVVAGLNILGRFVAGAASPILFNLSLILAISYGMLTNFGEPALLRSMVVGVLIGGLLQLLVPVLDLYRQGWRPKLRLERSADCLKVRELLIPGLIGAGVVQMNLLLSRFLAYGLDDGSVSMLFLATRLMELPLGVGTFAIATVFFPLLARAATKTEGDLFQAVFFRGMRMVLALSIAAGAGLFVLREVLVQLLFEWGAFTASDGLLTAPLVGIYAVCIPFYSLIGFCLRALHAKQQMKQPVRIAVICLLVNGLCGVILMQFWGAIGLASASLLVAWVQALLIGRCLTRVDSSLVFHPLIVPTMQALVSAAAMGIVCYGGLVVIASLGLAAKSAAALAVFSLVPLGALVYLLAMWLLRAEVVAELLDAINGRAK